MQHTASLVSWSQTHRYKHFWIKAVYWMNSLFALSLYNCHTSCIVSELRNLTSFWLNHSTGKTWTVVCMETYRLCLISLPIWTLCHFFTFFKSCFSWGTTSSFLFNTRSKRDKCTHSTHTPMPREECVPNVQEYLKQREKQRNALRHYGAKINGKGERW